MELNPLALALNETLKHHAPSCFEMLSEYGKKLYFPKGIITQSQEAKEHATRFNATIGIATENGPSPMHLQTAHRLLSHEFHPEEVYPYAPAAGLPALRQAWKQWIAMRNPSLRTDLVSTPLVVNAITHGLSLCGEVFLNPGDNVLTTDKFWGNYRLMWELKLQAKLSTFPLFDDHLRGFHLSAFEEALQTHAGGKLMVVLNFPNNPTGYTPTPAEAQGIAEALLRAAQKPGTQLIVLLDDAYFGMSHHPAAATESLFCQLAQLHENLLAVKIDGATKELFMWGVRVGFVTFGTKGVQDTFYKALETKFAAAIRAQISNVSHLGQSFLLKTLQSADCFTEMTAKLNLLKTRYTKAMDCAQRKTYADLWDVYPCNSGYFLCLKLRTIPAETLRLYLLHHKQLGIISTAEKDARVAFSCLEPEQIPQVFETIAQGVRSLSIRSS